MNDKSKLDMGRAVIYRRSIGRKKKKLAEFYKTEKRL